MVPSVNGWIWALISAMSTTRFHPAPDHHNVTVEAVDYPSSSSTLILRGRGLPGGSSPISLSVLPWSRASGGCRVTRGEPATPASR